MIIKPIDDWIRIWEKINDLTKIYQSSIIGKTLNFLESLENKKLEMIKEGYQLIDFLSQNDFNLEEAIKFLNKIKYVYNWDSFLKNLKILKELRKITHVAINIDDLDYKSWDCSLNKNEINRVFLGNYYYKFDTKKDNKYQMVINLDNSFIYEQINSYQVIIRTLYLANFNLDYKKFESNEEMNLVNIKLEKDKVFLNLLNYFKSFNLKVDILDPNQIYEQDLVANLNNYYVYKTNGEIININQGQVLVKEADYVVRIHVVKQQISDIKVVINPYYYQHLKHEKYLKEDLALVLKKKG